MEIEKRNSTPIFLSRWANVCCKVWSEASKKENQEHEGWKIKLDKTSKQYVINKLMDGHGTGVHNEVTTTTKKTDKVEETWPKPNSVKQTKALTASRAHFQHSHWKGRGIHDNNLHKCMWLDAGSSTGKGLKNTAGEQWWDIFFLCWSDL